MFSELARFRLECPHDLEGTSLPRQGFAYEDAALSGRRSFLSRDASLPTLSLFLFLSLSFSLLGEREIISRGSRPFASRRCVTLV